MDVSTEALIFLAVAMFFIGLYGVIFRRNILLMLMSLELLLNAANVIFVAAGRVHGRLDGQVMVLFVITVAACEAAIGLALSLGFYRKYGTIEVDFFKALRG